MKSIYSIYNSILELTNVFSKLGNKSKHVKPEFAHEMLILELELENGELNHDKV